MVKFNVEDCSSLLLDLISLSVTVNHLFELHRLCFLGVYSLSTIDIFSTMLTSKNYFTVL